MSLSEGTRGEGVLLHTAAIVAEDFAFLTQVLRVLLTLVGYVQAIGLLQRALERGRENVRIGDSRDECVLKHTHTHSQYPCSLPDVALGLPSTEPWFIPNASASNYSKIDPAVVNGSAGFRAVANTTLFDPPRSKNLHGRHLTIQSCKEIPVTQHWKWLSWKLYEGQRDPSVPIISERCLNNHSAVFCFPTHCCRRKFFFRFLPESLLLCFS